MNGPANPDCRAGKHGACAGDAWDDETDTLGTCPCPCHDLTPAQELVRAVELETDERDLSRLDRLDGLDTRR